MPAGGAPDHHRAPPSAAALLRKSAPGQPWSHQETIALIEAYEEKWCSLKRGQLKAQQWEEVAADVAARCGLDDPSKTGTQCRHKIEKLRKRYRAERVRVPPSPWPYFNYMDRMERGPLPISVRTPGAAPQAPGPRGGGAADASSEDEDEDDDDGDDDEKPGSNIRSINGILREANWRFPGASGNDRPPKRRDFDVEHEEDEEEQEEEEEEEEDREEGGRQGVVSQLAAVVGRFGEGLVRMEKRRMEMMREVERDWMEMEAKRAEMVIESQRCLLETITAALSPHKKAKKSQDDV